MKLIDKIKELLHRSKTERVNLVYPTSWEAMDLVDFKNVCILLATPKGRDETLFLALCMLAHIRPDNVARYKRVPRGLAPYIINGKPYFIKTSVIAEACGQLSFILDDIGLPPAPLKDVDRKLFGVSFEDFYEADSLIARARTEGNDVYLKEAVKTLTGGRKRKLLPWEKKAVVIWWTGAKMFLKSRYPHVFEDGGSVTDRTQHEILMDLLSCMNDNRPQQNDRILKTDCHSVLYSLNQIYANAKQGVSVGRPAPER